MFLPVEPYFFDEANLRIIHENCPIDEQRDTRLASVIFMRKLGDALGLPYYTISTASYFFHYFFMFYSMKKFSYIDVAITCILVGTKSEETYRKIKQILVCSCKLLNPSFKGIGLDNAAEFDHHRNLVTSYERLLLDVIQFKFACIHPHEYALKFAKILCPDCTREETVEVWEIIQLFFCTEFCLKYPVVYYALIAVFLSIKCQTHSGAPSLALRAETEYAQIMGSSDSSWKTELQKWKISVSLLGIFAKYVEQMKRCLCKATSAI